MSNKLNKTFKLIGFIIFLLIVWQVVYEIKIWPAWLFPSPIQVGHTLIKGFVSGQFVWGILISLRRLLIGFCLSVIIGTLLGFAIYKYKLLQDTVDPLILGLQTLPSVCWLPLALLWFGLNDQAIIFVIIMGTVLSVTIAVKSAVFNIPAAYFNAGKILGARKIKLYRHVVIPAMLPGYVAGIKHAWSFAWRSLMNGEMLFISIGLGQLLMFGRELNDMSQVMAVMLVIIIIGIIFDYLIFGKLEKILRSRWGLGTRN